MSLLSEVHEPLVPNQSRQTTGTKHTGHTKLLYAMDVAALIVKEQHLSVGNAGVLVELLKVHSFVALIGHLKKLVKGFPKVEVQVLVLGMFVSRTGSDGVYWCRRW